MTGAESFDQICDRHRQLLATANGLNKKAVFDALSAAGITSVTVVFDGEGDDGQVRDVAAHAGDQFIKLPKSPITVHAAPWGATSLRAQEHELLEAIEELCYGFLEHEHGGWENNDGAYGEFRFNVRSRTIELEFNARFTDVATDTREL